MDKNVIFLDSSFLTNTPRRKIKKLLKKCKTKIAEPIYNEILEFKKLKSLKEVKRTGVSLIFKKENLKPSIEIIKIKDFKKTNPLFCRLYFHFMHLAMAPDYFANISKFLHASLVNKFRYGNISKKELLDIEAKTKAVLLKLVNESVTDNDPVGSIGVNALLKNRKKKIKSLVEQKEVNADEQNAAMAIVFSLMHRKNVFIATSDKDYIEILENIIGTSVEYFSRYNIILEMLDQLKGSKEEKSKKDLRNFINKNGVITFKIATETYLKRFNFLFYEKWKAFLIPANDTIAVGTLYYNKVVGNFRSRIFYLPEDFIKFFNTHYGNQGCFFDKKFERKFNEFRVTIDPWDEKYVRFKFRLKPLTIKDSSEDDDGLCSNCIFVTNNIRGSFSKESDLDKINL